MNYDIISQIGIGVFGSTAFLLVTAERKKLQKLGVFFGLCSNPFWWMMVFVHDQYYTIPIHALYTFGWLKKAYHLFIKK
tara:strand:- start:1140 stop:1376 length:237 start_codon:yes stop_codon:yes gene_type:complete